MVKRTKSEEEEHRVTLIIISIVLAFTLIALLYFYKDVHINSPELILPILLILGVMALIVTLSYTTAIFHQLGLSDPDRTLGLPEGSMQAIIALSLILIFLISSDLLTQIILTSRNTGSEIIVGAEEAAQEKRQQELRQGRLQSSY